MTIIESLYFYKIFFYSLYYFCLIWNCRWFYSIDSGKSSCASTSSVRFRISKLPNTRMKQAFSANLWADSCLHADIWYITNLM